MINILLSLWTFGEPYLKSEIQQYIHPTDKVAIVSFAQNDLLKDKESYDNKYGLNGKHYILPKLEFEKFGIQSENIDLVHYYDDAPETMKRKIQNADILLFTGGMPDRAIERLKEKGIYYDVLSFDKVIIGYSAGALMQLKKSFLSPDEDYPELTYLNGLSYVDNNFYIEVHYDDKEHNWKQLLQGIREKDNMPVYAMGNYGAVVIDHDRNINIFGDVTIFN